MPPGPGTTPGPASRRGRGVTMTVRSRRGGYGVLAALGLWLLGLQASSSMQAPGVPAAAAQAPGRIQPRHPADPVGQVLHVPRPGTQPATLRFDSRGGGQAGAAERAHGHRAAATRTPASCCGACRATDPKRADAAARRAARRATRSPCCAGGSSRARSGRSTGRSSRRAAGAARRASRPAGCATRSTPSCWPGWNAKG